MTSIAPLQAKSKHIVSVETNEPIQLKGISLFWSSWGAEQFYNAETVKHLIDHWNINVIRAAINIDEKDGYIKNPQGQIERLTQVVEAAIANNIYVLIDFHSHHAIEHIEVAKACGKEIGKIFPFAERWFNPTGK